VLLNHGLLSAIVCVAAMEKVIQADDAPDWLRHALEAILYHDYELNSHKAKEGPIRANGKRREMSFDQAPVAFLLRLADKLHSWERPVRGKTGLVQEATSVMLKGLVWPAHKAPVWLAPPILEIAYDDHGTLVDAGWEHSKLVEDLHKYLGELPFPDGLQWSGRNGKPVRFQFRVILPKMDPTQNYTKGR